MCPGAARWLLYDCTCSQYARWLSLMGCSDGVLSHDDSDGSSSQGGGKILCADQKSIIIFHYYCVTELCMFKGTGRPTRQHSAKQSATATPLALVLRGTTNTKPGTCKIASWLTLPMLGPIQCQSLAISVVSAHPHRQQNLQQDNARPSFPTPTWSRAYHQARGSSTPTAAAVWHARRFANP